MIPKAVLHYWRLCLLFSEPARSGEYTVHRADLKSRTFCSLNPCPSLGYFCTASNARSGLLAPSSNSLTTSFQTIIHQAVPSVSPQTSSSHPKPTPQLWSTSLLLRLRLHLLADLHVDLEEFAHTPIQAYALAFVEVGFAVFRGNALLGAGVCEAVEGSRQRMLQSAAMGRLDMNGWRRGRGYSWYRLNISETISTSVSAAAIFSVEEI